MTVRSPPGAACIAPRDETIGYLVWDARRAYSRDFAERIERHGIGLGAFSILRILWEEDGLTQARIVERARMSGPTIVAIVAGLERQRLIRRVDEPGDNRKKRIVLTARARRLADAILPLARDINEQALRGFSPLERRRFMSYLRRLRDNFVVGGVPAPETGATTRNEGKTFARARGRRPAEA